MKRAEEWFAEYDQFHRNSTNKWLHAICIPIIMFSLLGALSCVPIAEQLGLDGAILLVALSLVYYFLLSPALAISMAVISIGMLLGNHYLAQAFPGRLLGISGLLFFLGWIGQFVGHKIEGKKPAFFDDLRFLLIGPLWLVAFVYRRWGIRY